MSRRCSTNSARQHEMAMSVDEAVAQIMHALGDRLTNTLIIYTSDNGLMNGSHRLETKDVPYRMATAVPTGVRWDGHVPVGINTRVTPNVDLTATIAEAAGFAWSRDGRSLLSQSRFGSVLEQIENPPHPAYCGYRSSRYQYVAYVGQGDEFYDYQKDPSELVNRVHRIPYASRVAKLREKAISACSPTPPGFAWDQVEPPPDP